MLVDTDGLEAAMAVEERLGREGPASGTLDGEADASSSQAAPRREDSMMAEAIGTKEKP